MSRRQNVAFIALALTGCSTHRPLFEREGGLNETMMIIGGGTARLAAFEAAARACGVDSLRRMPDGNGSYWVQVTGSVRAFLADTGPLPCTTKWLHENPEGLHFIGNAPRQ